MANGSRILQQHKPQRESEARERADLKREIKALRKQVTRLRRQNQKVEDAQSNASESASEDSIAVQEGAVPGGGCEACGGFNLIRLVLPGGGVIAGCKDCKHRKKT